MFALPAGLGLSQVLPGGILFLGATSAAETSNNVTGQWPTGLQPGDLVLAAITSANASATISAQPTGWSVPGGANSAGTGSAGTAVANRMHLRVYRVPAEGVGDPPQFVTGSSGSSGTRLSLLAFRNVFPSAINLTATAVVADMTAAPMTNTSPSISHGPLTYAEGDAVLVFWSIPREYTGTYANGSTNLQDSSLIALHATTVGDDGTVGVLMGKLPVGPSTLNHTFVLGSGSGINITDVFVAATLRLVK